MEVFTEELMDQRKESGKTTIYIWDDGYWETLEKSISRNIPLYHSYFIFHTVIFLYIF